MSDENGRAGREETIARLIERVGRGDGDARERLLRRYLRPLQRWARSRLPDSGRGSLDTDDLVRVTLLRTLEGVKGLGSRGPGSFVGNVRRNLEQRFHAQILEGDVRHGPGEVDERAARTAGSPLERAIGRDGVEAYERGLASLPAEQQEAVTMRIELGLDYAEIAEALDWSTPEIARTTIARALVRVAEVMDE